MHDFGIMIKGREDLSPSWFDMLQPHMTIFVSYSGTLSLVAERIAALVLDLERDRLEALALPRRSVLPSPVVLATIAVDCRAPLLRLLLAATPFFTIDTVLGGAPDREWLFSLTSRTVRV